MQDYDGGKTNAKIKVGCDTAFAQCLCSVWRELETSGQTPRAFPGCSVCCHKWFRGCEVNPSIPKHTQERVREAARELNYRPNFMARSLRRRRSFTVGVVVPEISEGYAALALSGIEDHLLDEGYFYFVVSHRHRKELIEEYPQLQQQRAVEGLIAVDIECPERVVLPLVAVSGHREIAGVTNIALNHALVAKLALEHLTKLGHSKIAFIKGQAFSSDTDVRKLSILRRGRWAWKSTDY